MATNVPSSVCDISSQIIPLQMKIREKIAKFLIRGKDVKYLSDRKYSKRCNSVHFIDEYICHLCYSFISDRKLSLWKKEDDHCKKIQRQTILI